MFTNKPVQGGPGMESAGYHGYWVTDFTRVDPHLGTEADMKALVAAAHGRGMKVYMDIIANHTADVIAYRECPTDRCTYRSRADYPYSRRGGLAGEPINAGFAGDGERSEANFARLTRADFAYTPYVPEAEARVKMPAWLNDPIFYHNRGNSTFAGESSEMGDFVGLDDLMTENPRVAQGFIEIYGGWIDRYGVDGFRIDTARHVNAEFWQAFVPAMRARAQAKGIPNFHIFGEIFDLRCRCGRARAPYARRQAPLGLDFAFANAVRATVAGDAGTDVLARVFADDALYEGGEETARQLPTFVSNHDAGRFAWFVRTARPQASDDEVLNRVLLAHAMLLTLRGVPVVYYGDEQGFAGDGERPGCTPRHVRQPDAVLSCGSAHRRERRRAPTFDRNHPIYRAIAELSALRLRHAALRVGGNSFATIPTSPGCSRSRASILLVGREIVVAFNTATEPLTALVEIDAASERFRSLRGRVRCRAESHRAATRSQLAPLDFIVCAAGEPQ